MGISLIISEKAKACMNEACIKKDCVFFKDSTILNSMVGGAGPCLACKHFKKIDFYEKYKEGKG